MTLLSMELASRYAGARELFHAQKAGPSSLVPLQPQSRLHSLGVVMSPQLGASRILSFIGGVCAVHVLCEFEFALCSGSARVHAKSSATRHSSRHGLFSATIWLSNPPLLADDGHC